MDDDALRKQVLQLVENAARSAETPSDVLRVHDLAQSAGALEQVSDLLRVQLTRWIEASAAEPFNGAAVLAEAPELGRALQLLLHHLL